MTNLDRVLKSRDITLLTKVHIVETMVFLVVMYRCESWTIKAECWRIDAFKLWCWRRPLRVPWTAKRSSQSIIKEIIHWLLKLKLQYFGYWIWRADSLEKTPMLGKTEAKEGGEMFRLHHQLNGHEFKQTPRDSGGQRSLGCCSPWCCKVRQNL